jgi:hypothetical protein
MSHGLAAMAPSGFLSRLTKCAESQDVRLDPLDVRKATLATVLARAAPGLRFNEHLDDEDGPLVWHIRSHGCRDLLLYCGSINCSHGAKLNADHMPDDTPIRPLVARMVCTRCGMIGADVRPDWSPHVNKRCL